MPASAAASDTYARTVQFYEAEEQRDPFGDAFDEGSDSIPPDADTGAEDDDLLPPLLYGEERRQKELNDLFETLAKAPNAVIGKRVANAIQMKWNESGSATVDRLMEEARKAMRANRNDVAFDLIGESIVLAPDYPEAWNLRATVHFLQGNMEKSMVDIERVLALEPRHFGALTGMAAILQQAGRDSAALAIYERALEIFPTLEAAKKQTERLRKSVENQTL
ncbi:tetratricopeptide repeat protein [Notoacmeibacter sp. MSK16QG-6]|uniref:tetratricopeptide repeat protein n=1 Tax=Notoacmeibacter sp. MSK16QG-6 TaxID=2957982 RepID=UPI00209D8E7D|nr:tetratricopeptide repeat protein [Notoacmeibacter sp. MSK16QG-6]MCP1200158.1 tetratricopeptide repeat protein [Notoacmeibacter sp. MSK16QG-6]